MIIIIIIGLRNHLCQSALYSIMANLRKQIISIRMTAVFHHAAIMAAFEIVPSCHTCSLKMDAHLSF